MTQEEVKLRDEIGNKTSYKTVKQITINELADAISDTYKPIDITVERSGKIIEFKDFKVPNTKEMTY